MKYWLYFKFIICSFFTSFLLLNSPKAQAQRTIKIYKKDGGFITGKIVDISADSVYYKSLFDNNFPIIKISKTEISRLVFKDNLGISYDISENIFVKKSHFMPIEKSDKIYLKSGNFLSVQVIDLGSDTIRYQAYFSRKSPILGKPKTDVDFIVLKNGTSYYYNPNKFDSLFISINKSGLLSDTFRTFIPNYRSIGLNINVGGPSLSSLLVSLNLDAFFNKNLSVELGAPVRYKITGFYGGFKFHYPLRTNYPDRFFSLYTGTIFGRLGDKGSEKSSFLYFPIGFHSTFKTGVVMAFEVGFIPFLKKDIDSSFPFFIWGQLRVGYRFKNNRKTTK